MTRWTFPIKYKYSLSIFQQCKVILFESLHSSCLIKFWLFSTKNDDFYFKSKKKFPDGTDLLDGWIFRVFRRYYKQLFEHWSNFFFKFLFSWVLKYDIAFFTKTYEWLSLSSYLGSVKWPSGLMHSNYITNQEQLQEWTEHSHTDLPKSETSRDIKKSF